MAETRKDILAVSGMFLANGVMIGAWSPHIPLIAARHGLSEASLSLALLAVAGGGIAGMFLIPLATARVRAHRLAVIGGIGFALSLSLPMLAPGYATLVATAAIFGLCGGAMDVAMNAEAVELERRAGRAIMSRFHGWFSVGGFIGAIITGQLLSWSIPPWINALILGGIALLLLAPAVFSFVAATMPAHSPKTTTKQTRHISAIILPLCVIAFAGLVAEGAMGDWSAKYLHDLGASAMIMSSGYAAFALGMAGGRFAGDRAVHHLGSAGLIAGGAALAAIGIGAGLIIAHPVVIVPGLFAAGLGLANIIPVAFREAGRVTQNPAGAIAFVTACGYSGLLIGPVVIGGVAEWVGLRSALWLVVLGLIAVTIARRYSQASTPSRQSIQARPATNQGDTTTSRSNAMNIDAPWPLRCRGILFDLDGTLVDSSGAVERCWQSFSARHGVPLEDILAISEGRPAGSVIAELCPDLDATAEDNLLIEQQCTDGHDLCQIEGAAELISQLPDHTWAVVTSGTQRLARFRLTTVGLPVPQVLVTADDIQKGKPDPEGFLQAANRLGFEPREVVVFEDSHAGVAAAQAAGMRVITVQAAARKPTTIGQSTIHNFREVNLTQANGHLVLAPAQPEDVDRVVIASGNCCRH